MSNMILYYCKYSTSKVQKLRNFKRIVKTFLIECDAKSLFTGVNRAWNCLPTNCLISSPHLLLNFCCCKNIFGIKLSAKYVKRKKYS